MCLTSVCLSFFDPTAGNDVFHCKYCKGFHTASRKGVSRVIICSHTCSHLGERRRTIAHCLFAKPTKSNFKPFVFFYFCRGIFWVASKLVRAAMDSDDEIFLKENTFSQEPFSPELNLEELVGDFREVSEREIHVYG